MTAGPRATAERSAFRSLDLSGVYRTMLLARALDERIGTLAQQGRVGIACSIRGHEAAQVASAAALRPERDVVVPYYRDLGVVLSLGVTPLDILLGALDRADDPFSGAKQMPFHFTSARLRMPPPSTSIGTQLPHAVGAALACRLSGDDAVTLVYFGDGAASKSDFHESLNFAAIHMLPVVFFCENNQYAISVPLTKQMAVSTIAERGDAYGVPGERFDGTDVEETYKATRAALERARAGDGPTLLEAAIYRLGPHTSHDDDTRYRPRDEVQNWEARDPIDRLRDALLKGGEMTSDQDQKIRVDVRREIEAALASAEAAPAPRHDAAFSALFSDYAAPDPFGRTGDARGEDTLGVRATETQTP